MSPQTRDKDAGVAEATRVRLGASAFASDDVLLALATDPAATVRATVAMNPAAPHGVDQVLARDPDERIRTLLARKVASELPGLSGDEQARLRDQALSTLATLVEDEAVRVRAALADVLKDMHEAPRALILQLARDSAVPVSEPVIHLSPLLDAGDLLALLASPPHNRTTIAVARRAGLPEAVSDAVAATADAEAVRALLCNPSAQIRESTLDALVARAEQHVEWHEPLVHRPTLPAEAMLALSRFVTGYLVEALRRRGDLDPHLAEELDKRTAAHLAVARAADARAAAVAVMPNREATGAAPSHDEAAVIAATRLGDARRAAFLLAAAANVPLALIDRAGALRSAKGIVSLVWKAGFTMRVAGPLQAVLAQLSPDAMLLPGVDGQFPLSVEEMRWYCDFLARPAR